MSRKEYFRIAHSQGAEAKSKGWERNSSYTKLKAERYWLAGYDGEDFEQFHKFINKAYREAKSVLGYTRIDLNNV